MTFKRIIGSLLQFSQSLIPFYWLAGLVNKSNKLDLEVNQRQLGVNMYTLQMLMFVLVAMFTLSLFLVPAVGQVGGIGLGIFIGIGIMPAIYDGILKHSTRGLVWLITRNDPAVINKTNPNKYRPYAHSIYSKVDEELVQLLTEDNNSTHLIMDKLYKKKQEIKQNPEGWFGLSDIQKEQSKDINIAVSHFRKKSFYGINSFDPSSGGPSNPNALYPKQPHQFNADNGVTNPEMQNFLAAISVS